MQMKKRVLSVLLALCLAGSLASTAWAAGDQATPETAEADTSAVVLNEEEEQQDETTASQEETSGEDSTAAPAEDPVAQVTETEADDGSVEYTAALETDGQPMNVVVTAPEGAFAEDVQPELSVTMLTAEDELNAVADKLATAEVQYDGFTALDITFTDKATGEEIEPVQQVSVRIELPQTIVDSGIDLNTLAVQHLEEDENGDFEKVTKVATLDNGITLSEEAAAAANEAAGVAPMSDMPAEEATAGDAAETPAAVAEFEVDGFSYFTITWKGTNNSSLSIRIVDSEGNSIGGGEYDFLGSASFVTDKWISVNDLVDAMKENTNGALDEYTLDHVEVRDWNGDIVTDNNNQHSRDVKLIRANTEDWYYKYVNEIRYSKNQSETSKTGGRNLGIGQTIYFVFDKTEGEPTDPGTGGDQGGTTVANATVTTTKTAYLRDDDSGNYDLTLSISGDRGSITNPKAVDVLFVVDKSGSMEFGLNEHHYEQGQEVAPDKYSGDIQRIAGVQQAVAQITNNLSANENLDVRYALVTFSGDASAKQKYNYYELNDDVYDDAEVANGWTDNETEIQDTVNGIEPVGGTNYEAGLSKAKDLLAQDTGRGALRVVIFLSDGDPSYYYSIEGTKIYTDTMAKIGQNYHTIDARSTAAGHTVGSGSGYDEKAMEAAKAVCQDFKPNYFYCVAVGPEAGEDGTIYKHLKELENAVAVPAANSDTYSGDNTDDLLSAFNSIQQEITFFAATDVTITDPLSQYADLVLTNEAPQFTITVTREASDDVKADSWSGTVGPNETVTFYNAKGEAKQATARVSEDNRTIYMDLPVGYELEPGYTYSISTVITPSQEALTAGMNSDAAKQTPDAGTGTHADANQQGFWSNINDDPNTEAVEGAQVTFTANGEDGSQAFPKPVIQVPEKTTVDLTLEKTFVGLTDAEVNYLIFLRDDGFGWDINYCQPELREGTEKKDGKETTYATYMADEDAVKGITLPDGTAVTGGGDFRITAKQFLSKSGEGESGLNNIDGIGNQTSGYTNSITGASLKKVGDNWVYSVTLQVPKAEGGYFYTVFEQHGEVPGYAKLDDSNVVYTVTGIEGLTDGTGKFIDNAGKNVYVDMDTEVDSVDVTVNGNNYTIDGEEAAINQGVLQKLEIADDTTIAFENNYTGNLKVSKTVRGISDEDLTSAALANKAFTITLQPSENIVNLELLDGRTINYTITNNGTMTTGSAVMDKDDNCAIQVDLKYGDTITFQEIPAIQYTVTENAPATTGGYDFGSYTWIGAEYSETSEHFENPQKVNDHWNHNGLSEPDRRYYTTIGTDNAGDHILSVDSKIGDSRPVQTLQITNEYVEYKSLTIEKDITGTLAIPTDRFTFTITGATGITESDIEKIGDDTSKITVTVADGTITANLGKGDSITINHLTDDHELKISENSGDYTPIIDLTGVDGYVEGNPSENTETQHSGFIVAGNQVTVEVKSVTDESENGTSLGTVKYNNQKNVTPPTGLESNHTTPYTLMVTAAGIAGLALIGGIVVRRRRRRME